MEKGRSAEPDAAGPRLVGDWELGQQIGIGSFSVVWFARHRDTGQEAAVKEIPLGRLDDKLRQSLESEVAVLRRIRHPNVVSLLDICRRHDRLFLILEFCAAGDLSQLIRTRGPLPEREALFFFRQLAAGLRALRKAELIHRDLKPQNLLLSAKDDRLQLKIADFGFVRELRSHAMAQTLCGSPLYMAPEILRYQQYDSSVDLWSVGAILYEMVCGRPPFTGQNPRHLLHNIDRHEAVVPASLRGNLSPQCQDMIRRLLRRRPAERIPWPDFFAHPFLASEAECPASPDTPAVAESELQREISQVARQIDCARLTREVTAACPSAVEIRRHHEYVSRREAEESASPRGAGPGGEHLLGGDYVVVDEGGAGEAAGAQGEEEADVGVDGGSGVGRMRRVMLHGLPGHLSEPSTLLRLPIAVEDGMEEEHLGARLHNLQCSAGAVWECARDVAALGNWFEAVSLMLLCLTILETAHKLAKSVLQGTADHQDPELCMEAARVEPVLRSGMRIVVKTVDAVRQRAAAEDVDEPGALPDAAEVLYSTAIQAGRGGAVAELMGDVREAAMRYVQAAGALNVLLQASPPGHGPGSPSGNDPNGSFGAASQHSAQGAGSYHSAHHGPVLELSSPAASPKGEEGSSGRGCPALGALQMGPRKPFVEGFQGMEFEPGHRIQLLHYLGVLVSRAYPLLQDMEEHPEPGVEAHVMRPIDSSDGVMAATEGVAT